MFFSSTQRLFELSRFYSQQINEISLEGVGKFTLKIHGEPGKISLAEMPESGSYAFTGMAFGSSWRRTTFSRLPFYNYFAVFQDDMINYGKI